MFQSNSPIARLTYQLVPAAVVSTIGIALLSSLGGPSNPAPPAQRVEPAIQGDAVFTATPRAIVAEEQHAAAKTEATARANIRPKPATAAPSRKVALAEPTMSRQPAPVAAPLPITPPSAQTAMAVNSRPPGLFPKLRRATVAAVTIPGRAVSRVAGWFAYDPPPRPPGEIPTQDFMKVSM